MLGVLVAAELASAEPGWRRWVDVVPPRRLEPRTGRWEETARGWPAGIWEVCVFEVQSAAFDREKAGGECIDVDERRVVDRWQVGSVEEAENALRTAGINPDSLDAPWHCDYPDRPIFVPQYDALFSEVVDLMHLVAEEHGEDVTLTDPPAARRLKFAEYPERLDDVLRGAITDVAAVAEVRDELRALLQRGPTGAEGS
jgi:hypothetical protein